MSLTCPWCGTQYLKHQPNCINCGGPLPPPPGADPGPAPPPPPRQLPSKFKKRVFFTRNVLVLIGVIFSPIGLLFTVIGALALLPMLVLGLIFLILGLIMFRVGWKKASAVVNALVNGRAIEGRITDVYYDTSVAINNRSPWAIVYSFEVDGVSYQGKAQTWDPGARERKPGQPIHVLYLPEDPETNTIYPPIK
jgi:hypothetical protein